MILLVNEQHPSVVVVRIFRKHSNFYRASPGSPVRRAYKLLWRRFCSGESNRSDASAGTMLIRVHHVKLFVKLALQDPGFVS